MGRCEHDVAGQQSQERGNGVVEFVIKFLRLQFPVHLNAIHTEQGLGVSSEAAIEFNQLVKSWKKKTTNSVNRKKKSAKM
jgi:hypothetical protein